MRERQLCQHSSTWFLTVDRVDLDGSGSWDADALAVIAKFTVRIPLKREDADNCVVADYTFTAKGAVTFGKNVYGYVRPNRLQCTGIDYCVTDHPGCLLDVPEHNLPTKSSNLYKEYAANPSCLENAGRPMRYPSCGQMAIDARVAEYPLHCVFDDGKGLEMPSSAPRMPMCGWSQQPLVRRTQHAGVGWLQY